MDSDTDDDRPIRTPKRNKVLTKKRRRISNGSSSSDSSETTETRATSPPMKKFFKKSKSDKADSDGHSTDEYLAQKVNPEKRLKLSLKKMDADGDSAKIRTVMPCTPPKKSSKPIHSSKKSSDSEVSTDEYTPAVSTKRKTNLSSLASKRKKKYQDKRDSDNSDSSQTGLTTTKFKLSKSAGKAKSVTESVKSDQDSADDVSATQSSNSAAKKIKYLETDGESTDEFSLAKSKSLIAKKVSVVMERLKYDVEDSTDDSTGPRLEAKVDKLTHHHIGSDDDVSIPKPADKPIDRSQFEDDVNNSSSELSGLEVLAKRKSKEKAKTVTKISKTDDESTDEMFKVITKPKFASNAAKKERKPATKIPIESDNESTDDYSLATMRTARHIDSDQESALEEPVIQVKSKSLAHSRRKGKASNDARSDGELSDDYVPAQVKASKKPEMSIKIVDSDQESTKKAYSTKIKSKSPVIPRKMAKTAARNFDSGQESTDDNVPPKSNSSKTVIKKNNQTDDESTDDYSLATLKSSTTNRKTESHVSFDGESTRVKTKFGLKKKVASMISDTDDQSTDDVSTAVRATKSAKLVGKKRNARNILENKDSDDENLKLASIKKKEKFESRNSGAESTDDCTLASPIKKIKPFGSNSLTSGNTYDNTDDESAEETDKPKFASMKEKLESRNSDAESTDGYTPASPKNKIKSSGSSSLTSKEIGKSAARKKHVESDSDTKSDKENASGLDENSDEPAKSETKKRNLKKQTEKVHSNSEIELSGDDDDNHCNQNDSDVLLLHSDSDERNSEETSLNKQGQSGKAKRRTADKSGNSAEKSDRKSSAPTNDQIERMKRYLRAAGIFVKYNVMLEGIKTEAAKVRRLKQVLEEAGLKGRLSMTACKKLKKKRDVQKEISELDMTNILDSSAGGRSTRRKQPQPKSASPNKEAKKLFSRLKAIADSDQSSD